MRVALVAPHPILPATSGDRLRATQLVSTLRHLGVDVHVISASYDEDGSSGSTHLVPGRPTFPIARLGWRAWLAGAGRLDPYAIHRWPPLRRRLAAAIEAAEPDVVDFQHTFTWFQLGIPSVVTVIDVNTHRLERAGASDHLVRRVRTMELAAVRGADVAVTLSELDAGRLGAMAGQAANIVTVPLGYDPGPGTGLVRERARTAAFVGSFGYRPNVEAVRILVERWPELSEAGGFERLLVIGKGASSHATPTDVIEVRSDVIDIPASLADADVLLVPLTSGGGVRVKIIEAMAMGLPVVSTAIGIEGLGAVDGIHASIAADLDALPAACRRVRPLAVRRALAQAARTLWEQSFSPSRMADGMLSVYERAAGRISACAGSSAEHTYRSPSNESRPARSSCADTSPPATDKTA